jgi:hypothetical protein
MHYQVQSYFSLTIPPLNIFAVIKDKDRPRTSPAILSHPAPYNYPPVMLVARTAIPRKTLGDRLWFKKQTQLHFANHQHIQIDVDYNRLFWPLGIFVAIKQAKS